MRLEQASRRLTSLAIVTTLSLGTFISAGMFRKASEGIDMTKSNKWSDLSPTAQQIFNPNPGEAADHLKASKIRYDKLHTKIQRSLAKGNLIHVEDGEGDDLWQNLLGIMENTTPTKVFLHGGFWKLRDACAHAMWDYNRETFGITKPEIMTLHGSFGKGLQSFDHAEGKRLLSEEDIQNLKAASLDLNNHEYLKRIDEATKSLKETLKNNDFTTIALKTAPAGLVDIIEEFKHKVAIIWTGPVERVPKSSTWETKYNYYQAPEEGDKLLDMKVPIVIVSPWTGNARMSAIIDKKFMPQYRALLPKGTIYIPTDLSFPGFHDLASMRLKPTSKFSYYIFALAEGLRDRMIESANVKAADLDAEEELIRSQDLSNAEFKEKREDINMRRASQLHLGFRWKRFRDMDTVDSVFREFCPVDHAVQFVTDPKMKQYVKEVVEVRINRPDKVVRKYQVDVTAERGTNVYIISQMDSKLLESKTQSMISWMATGEKSFNPATTNWQDVYGTRALKGLPSSSSSRN
ncbi:hypothetical protein PGT21_021187 [Puccinia graminis f. sp. tritici]|uniref:Uncharacterized protein n=1 Tax=Puccinia graminis f. sp. tritici TaxID=56615 RepID=A0A5B0LRA2_PUCGR|nr:hypothetical protein PGTUg99_003925 [Puccinia graminis f. sp. tritici]KAA1071848.1 hypothetical protein PGT21_021187 [Puccinia graminis f. sp. tritici]